MRVMSKKKREKFDKLMLAMLKRRFGLEWSGHRGKVPTRFGPLELHGFCADNIYSLFTCFDDPSKLPGEQVPYSFATPETHQTFSKGGAIGGNGFNGYSGKWNFHIPGDWTAEDAVCHIDKAFDDLFVEVEA